MCIARYVHGIGSDVSPPRCLLRDPSHRSPSWIFARRLGRIAFGAVLLAGTTAVFATALGRADSPLTLHTGEMLGFTWLAAVVIGAAAHGLVLLVRPSWDPETLFRESAMLPVFAIAVILPLTLHLLVALAFGTSAAGFDDWVRWSLGITGLAHAGFTVMCVLRVRQLLHDEKAMTPGAIYGYTVAISCLPFIVLLGLPPVLVAITGLPILPLLVAMRPWIERERAELAAMPRPLPRAALVARGR